MNISIILFLVILHILCSPILTIPYEVDVSWEFNERSDWGNATAEEMNMEIRTEGGELRCSIIGFNPKIESPRLFLNVTNRHYTIIRAKYTGVAKNARLLLRSGSQPSPDQQLLISKSYWEQRQPLLILSASDSISSSFNHSFILDGIQSTYYLSAASAGIHMILDLGSYRWITALRILTTGTNTSPKRCLLQQSLTSGVGPFETVKSFTVLQNTSNVLGEDSSRLLEQRFTGFNGYSRYWRLLILDNYGGVGIGIRELALDGYDETVTVVPFTLYNTGQYFNYYLPINTYLSGMLLRMRLELLYTDNVEINPHKHGKLFREGLTIDRIQVVRAPEVWKVRGCTDKYYETPNYQNAHYNVTTLINVTNGNLPFHSFIQHNMSYQYATTYDCPRSGGSILTLEGINFGAHPNVYIGNARCAPLLSNILLEGRVQQITCRLPSFRAAAASSGSSDNKDTSIASHFASQRVRVENGLHPHPPSAQGTSGLFFDLAALVYRTATTSPPAAPLVTNIASRKVDLVWAPPPGNVFDQMTVTGYKILWFEPQYWWRVNNITIGNITTTSIRGLLPATEYVFAIAALSEGRENALLPTDLYGRRNIANGGLAATTTTTNTDDDVSSDSWISEFSMYTAITGTLLDDFAFRFFNANGTLNHSSAGSALTNGGLLLNSLGPTGQYGSEGDYGLVLVGSTNIQNCNISSTCCDGYNATIGLSSCVNSHAPSVCAVLPQNQLPYSSVIDGVTRSSVPTNLRNTVTNAPAAISFLTLSQLLSGGITSTSTSDTAMNMAAKAAAATRLPTASCGPALRLTPSLARSSGAAWYHRKMNIREGFDTRFSFQISNPSQKCDRLDDVNTYCRSRGADGLAFVLQNVAPDALGKAGSGLGYEGIFNSLSVEIDTYYNYDQMDYYENHISIMTQGFRYNISANHSRSLGNTNQIPDLTDGIHTMRITYEPILNTDMVTHPAFQANGHAAWFMNNADFVNGGEPDWGTGLGMMCVYLDDLYSPVIVIPINLDTTLRLDNGRSYVGITAATGDNHWQAHDVYNWQFSSLYMDELYTAPLIVNNVGDYRCVNDSVCVHRPDYVHYNRYNNLWQESQ